MGAEMVLLLLFLILCVVCAFQESKVTGLYRTYGVYGRVSAYLAFDLTAVGAVVLIAAFVPQLREMVNEDFGAVTCAVAGLICLAVGLLLYVRALKKCPGFLKSKCIISMIVTALGITMKLCVFFLFAVWKVTAPKTMVGADGREVFVISGEVYDILGNHVGTMTGPNTYVRI